MKQRLKEQHTKSTRQEFFVKDSKIDKPLAYLSRTRKKKETSKMRYENSVHLTESNKIQNPIRGYSKDINLQKLKT